MLSLPSSAGGDAGPTNIFTLAVSESEIVEVARDLFASGHYSLAVQEAYKAVDKLVAGLSEKTDVSGTSLMELVFSPKSPVLVWTERKTSSQQDEQAGYHRLFAGAMMGIRNPVTHEFDWVNDSDVALELLIFAQHLVRKAKAAYRFQSNRPTS